MTDLTVEEAAQLAGLTEKALRGRIDRGQLRAVRDGNRIRVPLGELYRAGLIAVRGNLEVAALLDRLEQAHARIGQLEAENQRLRDD